MEPSIEGDFAARELTRTDFDFLHAGLALSDVSRVCLLVLTGVLAVDVIAALMNWLDWPKLRTFRPHGLQTRSECCMKWKNGNPTSLQISADTETTSDIKGGKKESKCKSFKELIKSMTTVVTVVTMILQKRFNH